MFSQELVATGQDLNTIECSDDALSNRAVEVNYCRQRQLALLSMDARTVRLRLGFAVIIIVSLLMTKPPAQHTQELVEHVRYPDLKRARAA